MLVVVAFMRAVKMPVVQVPDVVAVLDCDVAAVWTVYVLVVFVDLVFHTAGHLVSLYRGPSMSLQAL